MKTTATLLLIALAYLDAHIAHADIFGNGTNIFDIEFVNIGNLDNPDDTTGNPTLVGKVKYAYRMGKFEISRDMITKANIEGDLGISMHSMSFVTGGARDDMPATGVTWFEAATFVNWLNTSQGHSPAYKYNGSTFELWLSGDAGYNSNNLFRNNEAHYFLPNTDEWYKAAYYDTSAGIYYDYPTSSDTAPTAVASGTAADTAVYSQPFIRGPANITRAGGLSPYGTVGQGGNVFEWEESEFFRQLNNSITFLRGIRGGSWISNFSDLRPSLKKIGFPSSESHTIGFRVASIPEPGTLLLGVLATAGLSLWGRQ